MRIWANPSPKNTFLWLAGPQTDKERELMRRETTSLDFQEYFGKVGVELGDKNARQAFQAIKAEISQADFQKAKECREDPQTRQMFTQMAT